MFGTGQIETTACDFKIRDEMQKVIVSVSVEDLVVFSPERCEVNWAGIELKSLFRVTDLGKLKN